MSINSHLYLCIYLFTSGDIEAVFTVHHVFVDPHAVPSFHMAHIAVTHLALPKHTRLNTDTLNSQLHNTC